ncbi:hypothetical protein [Limisalsivibrio acetivorans]|uniref:hypothetical protein n=1 Tax=Limisalsivibrio acetivorans TaxID=1304888 RepID=UPI0003B41682|nr:hypothetical protein [Limisalsivibrio acetivorans]
MSINSFLPKIESIRNQEINGADGYRTEIQSDQSYSHGWNYFTDIRSDFVDNIDIGLINQQELSSFIPNIWSRVILAKISDTTHDETISNILTDELRGLYAVIILRNYYPHLDIRFEEYTFSSAEEEWEKKRIVDSIAKNLYSTSITSLHFLYVNNQIMGGLIQSDYYTGLFPAAEYPDSMSSAVIPWFSDEDRILKDPLDCDYMWPLSLNNVKMILNFWTQEVYPSCGNMSPWIFSKWQVEKKKSEPYDQHELKRVLPEKKLLHDEHSLSYLNYHVAMDINPNELFKDLSSTLYRSVDHDHAPLMPIMKDGVSRIYKHCFTGRRRKEFSMDINNNTMELTIDKLTFRHEFTSSQDVKLPVVCSWPDFHSDEWHEYYIWVVKKDDFEITPIVDGDTQHTEGRFAITWTMSTPPTGVSVKYKGREIGVLLMPKILNNIKGTQPGKKTNISVDVGTSHIAVMENDPEKDTIEGFRIKNRLLWVTVPEDKAGYLDYNKTNVPIDCFVSKDFMPYYRNDSEGTLSSVPVLMKLRVPDHELKGHSVLDSVAIVSMNNSIPPFVEDGVLSDEDFERIASRYKERVKWEHRSNRRYLGMYLRHISTLIRAELFERRIGVQDLNVYTSLPMGEDGDREELLNNIFANVGVKLVSESLAIARAEELMLGSSVPVVTVDVGGGTSDFAVWRKQRLYIETVVKFAGNIMNQYFMENPKILSYKLEWFGSKYRSRFDNIHRAMESINESTLSLLFKAGGTRFIDRLVNAGPSAVVELRSAQSLAIFSYSAIMFYAGMSLKRCKQLKGADFELGIWNDGEDKKNIRLTLFLAGNGWGYLDLLFGKSHSGAFVKKVMEVLQRSFNCGYGSNDLRIELKRSSNPKTEVAKGLLKDIYSEIHNIEPETKFPIVGENGFYESSSDTGKDNENGREGTGDTQSTGNAPEELNQESTDDTQSSPCSSSSITDTDKKLEGDNIEHLKTLFEVDGCEKQYDSVKEYKQYNRFIECFEEKWKPFPDFNDVYPIVQDYMTRKEGEVDEPIFFIIIKAAILHAWGLDLLNGESNS